MTNWVVSADVTNYTGVTLNSGNTINYAQSVIDIYSNTSTDVPTTSFKPRDLYLLKLAVSYQAVWMESQIDVLSRTDVSMTKQDGLWFTAKHADSLILAPLAKRALDKLSWRKARTLNPRPSRGYRRGLNNRFDNTNDDCFPWEGMQNYGNWNSNGYWGPSWDRYGNYSDRV